MPNTNPEIVVRNKPPVARSDFNPSPPPFTPPGWVWFLSAIAQVGKQLYGEAWTGKEPMARKLPAPIPGLEGLDDSLVTERLVASGRIIGMKSRRPPKYEIRPATPEEYAEERKAYLRYHRTINWLRERLWSGEIVVFTFDETPVPSKQWGDENFFTIATSRGFHHTGGKGRLFAKKADVDAMLKEPPDRNLTIGAEKQCQNWLVGLMENGEPTQAKPHYREHAENEFGVGTLAFDRAWRNAIAETGNTAWSRPGRKS